MVQSPRCGNPIPRCQRPERGAITCSSGQSRPFILIKFEVISPEGYRSSLRASLTVFFIKFSLNLIFDTNDYLPIATIFSTDNLALFIVS